MFERTYVVGLGGIGSALVHNVARIIAYQETAQELILVDGDKFSDGNKVRQVMREGKDEGRFKAEVQVELLKLAHPSIRATAVPKFIARVPKEDDSAAASNVFLDKSIVLSCLDNDPTRLLLSELSRTMTDFIIINGGNRLSDGHVFTSGVLGGIEFTKRLEDVYPDKLVVTEEEGNPGDLHCHERQKLVGGEQILATNVMTAAWMLSAYTTVIGLSRKGKEALEEGVRKKSEVIFDLERQSAASYGHALRKPRNVEQRRN